MGLRRDAGVALVILVATALTLSNVMPGFELGYLFEAIAYLATGPVWPMFWGFIVILGAGLVLDW